MKWGIIGLGSIAHKFASELLLEKEEVYAVASRSLDKAKEFASQYQCSHYYGSYDEILEDENIDIIYVATPHNSHAEITLKALEKNKNVLCEKPFGLDYDEVLRMIELAKKKKKFLMEAFWTRFNPTFLEIYKKNTKRRHRRSKIHSRRLCISCKYECKKQTIRPFTRWWFSYGHWDLSSIFKLRDFRIARRNYCFFSFQ